MITKEQRANCMLILAVASPVVAEWKDKRNA